MLRPLFVFVAVLALATSSGCYSSNALQEGASYTAVTVMLDGQPVENANVTFAPIDQGRSAYGRTNASGVAEMGTSNLGDGVFPGNYNVGVSKSEPDPEHIVHDVDAYYQKHGKFPETKMLHHTPEKYEDPASSGFSTTVAADQPNEVTLELSSN